MDVSRRRFVGASAALASVWQLQRAAAAQGFAAQSTVCRLTAEQEEGPFFFADEMVRGAIAEDRVGVPLALRLVVLDSRTCEPVPGVAVDIWHCDAMGLYSGFTKTRFGGPGGPGGPGPGGPPPMGGPGHNQPSDKFTFLRGVQMADASGVVSFQTVFPGFYQGRTNHIHFKVRCGGTADAKRYAAGHTSHTGQVFFPEDLSVRLMELEPYKNHAIHRTTQKEDGIYSGQNGALSVARVSGNVTAGLKAELIAAVDPTATPAPVQGGRR